MTTKKLHLRSIIHELLWFLRGETNVGYLRDHGVTIWDEWADEDGELGPRVRQAVAQLADAPTGATSISSPRSSTDQKTIPTRGAWSSAHGTSASWTRWRLLPCHALFQFYVADGRLSCQLYQRSADALLGVPFNIASYALLTHMVAQQCDLKAGDFIWTGGDCHLYLNHLEQADLQLSRTPYPLPRLEIRRRPPNLFDYAFEDFEIHNYRHHAAIKAPIAV